MLRKQLCKNRKKAKIYKMVAFVKKSDFIQNSNVDQIKKNLVGHYKENYTQNMQKKFDQIICLFEKIRLKN